MSRADWYFFAFVALIMLVVVFVLISWGYP